MNLNKEYQKQIQITQWIDENLRVTLPTDTRSLISIACFGIAIEHRAAICTLFNSGLFGSMFALLRSVFENYSRGLFFRYATTKKEIDLFKKDSFDLEFKDVIACIEESLDTNNTVLSSFKKTHGKFLIVSLIQIFNMLYVGIQKILLAL